MINIVVALQCEARPLIQYYRLRGNPEKNGFSLYHNEDICLVISGIGKINAAAATAYQYAITGKLSHCVWLNIGIAGHCKMQPGEAALANKITDAGTQQSWYPGIIIAPPCQTASVITVDNAENDYTSSALYEMESSGFYATASRFATTELIHCFKIVSDNPDNPSHNITEKSTEELISKHVETIDILLTQLKQLASEMNEIDRSRPITLIATTGRRAVPGTQDACEWRDFRR